jgi:hypothetical protein
MIKGLSFALSSNLIKFFKYDFESLRLEIYFKNGHVHHYHEVPTHKWRELSESSAQGKFFNEHIRNRYDFSIETPDSDYSIDSLEMEKAPST